YSRVNEEFIVFKISNSEDKDLAEDLFKSLEKKKIIPDFEHTYTYSYGGIGNMSIREERMLGCYDFYVSAEEFIKTREFLEEYSFMYEKLLTFCVIEKTSNRDDYDLILRKFEGTFLTILNA